MTPCELVAIYDQLQTLGRKQNTLHQRVFSGEV